MDFLVQLREIANRRYVRHTMLVCIACMSVLGIGDVDMLSWRWHDIDENMGNFLLSCACSFLFHLCFWYGLLQLSLSFRFVAWLILPVIIIVQFVVYYARSRYGVVCEELSVAIYNASWEQVKNYLNFRATVLFSLLIISLLVGIYVIRLVFTCNGDIRYKLRNAIICILLCSISASAAECIRLHFPVIAKKMIYCVVDKEPWRLTFPVPQTRDSACGDILYNPRNKAEIFSLYYSSYVPIWNNFLFFSSLYDFLNPNQLQSSAGFPSEVSSEPLPETVVFYIGESFRADHSPLNGYHRNTLPRISQMSNIINLPNLHCKETQTISSIYSFLVLKDATTNQPTHSSFLDVLVKHGYKAFLMVGTNSGTWYNTPLIAPLFVGRMSLHSRPSTPNGYPQGILELQNVTDSPLFIMIEDGAGHMPYKSSQHPFGTKDVIDRYDNAMVDIDMTVKGVIDCVKDQDAILFFTSDHGESFGENGRWGHGGPHSAKEQLHVCGFIWYSDLYKKRRPEVIRALTENAARFTSLDYVYHTIISMCGITSAVQSKKQDMTQK